MLQIKSAVAILVEVVDDLSKDEKNHTVAQMATQAVGRMEELIHNISQLHLIENLKSAPFLVNDAIVQSIHSLRRSWARRHEIHRVKYHQEELKPVIADRRAVSRILFLLLDNALKFSPKESLVEIKTQEEQVDPESPRQVTVKVIDKGIGIPPEKIEKIFEPFFQVDMGTTKQFGGAGVGLATAQMLAQSMGIEVKVTSQPGIGSTFYFSLPVAQLDSYS
jgi:signal transduction histidine kinase